VKVQEAGDLVPVVATGSTEGARHVRWLGKLAMASLVLLSFDSDAAGERAAHCWGERLANSKRWRPFWGDANKMLLGSGNVREWVEMGMR
jgi:hypothetical protein